jgi:hypothetical protein
VSVFLLTALNFSVNVLHRRQDVIANKQWHQIHVVHYPVSTMELVMQLEMNLIAVVLTTLMVVIAKTNYH